MSAKGKSTTSSFIPWDQFLELIAKLEQDKKPLFVLLFSIGGFTGLRISDILTMKYENFRNGNFSIKEKKTGKNRVITFNDELKKIVTRNARSEKGLIFTGKSGDVLSIQYINQTLKKIATTYGIKGNVSCHSLRKTFGRRIWDSHNQSDASLIKLSDIFNHSSTATTRRYLGITAQEIENVYLSM